MSKHRYIQYGCGLCAPPNWRNFDASPTLLLQRIPLFGSMFRHPPWPVFPRNVEYGDIVKGLRLQPDSCEAIYCSHVLEHLALDAFRVALRNTYKYLKPGGVFRLVVPDLEYLAGRYLDSIEPDAAIQFMEQAHLGKKQRLRGMGGFLREYVGNSQHLWMWDFKAIACELEQVGFRKVRRAYYGDAALTCFREVEDKGRWENCLGVECYK